MVFVQKGWGEVICGGGGGGVGAVEVERGSSAISACFSSSSSRLLPLSSIWSPTFYVCLYFSILLRKVLFKKELFYE
jgi:hypothetical protein